MVGLRDLVVPPNFPVEPMGWRPYYGSIDKKGTAGGTGRGQELRPAPFDDDSSFSLAAFGDTAIES